ncbi:hypothetical protein C0995_004277 [Termitomyces sp. Mi166|nr:hypothetical protein C0995_004277 [Termitomyces sp. Mi166\
MTTQPSQKLFHCYLGLSVVKQQLFPASDDSIPDHHSNPPPPPPPVLINNKKEYKVEEILNSHLFQHKLQFKVKWKGYGIKAIFWKPQENIHAPGLV